MNKIVSALLVVFFTVSVNAFAADAAPAVAKVEPVKVEAATPAAKVETEKHATAPAKKANHVASKKADKALKVAEVKTEATSTTK
ncbi:MAG: hypothetical protein H7Z18_11035 [Methylophilaceae bacterium]|nr:hypothetical protein [Methylophilaceae bacterium]